MANNGKDLIIDSIIEMDRTINILSDLVTEMDRRIVKLSKRVDVLEGKDSNREIIIDLGGKGDGEDE